MKKVGFPSQKEQYVLSLQQKAKIMANLRLELTCFACPEQYDVYHGDTLVGYIRYRWGHLKCNPVVDKEYMFENDIFFWDSGDQYDGIIPEDKKEKLLEKCKEAICKFHNLLD